MAIGKTYLYDPRAVLVIFAGIVIKDLRADEFFSAEVPEGYTWKPSVSGGGARAATNDFSGKIKIKLMQGSPHNKELQSQYNLDRASTSGAGVGSLTVKDANGTELYSAQECWIAQAPGPSFGKEVGDREWTLQAAELSAQG